MRVLYPIVFPERLLGVWSGMNHVDVVDRVVPNAAKADNRRSSRLRAEMTI